MLVKKLTILIIAFVAGFGILAQTQAQSLDQMSPAQLLRLLRTNISEFVDTENTIENNTTVADQNIKRVAMLGAEGDSLDARTATYDRDAINHNRQASAYIDRCQNGTLPEDVYTQCLTLKQNLDMQKARLDNDAEALVTDHAAYNLKVTALNKEEDSRVEAVVVLLEKYITAETAIRDIQVRLYEVSVTDNRAGFSEQVRQCTKRTELEDMYSCMTSVWGS